MEVSVTTEGRALILQSGGKQLFNGLLNCLPQSEIQICELVERIMRNLIENEGEVIGARTFEGQNDLERETINFEGAHGLQSAQIQHQQPQIEDMRSEFTAGPASNMAFSRRDFSIAQRAPPLPEHGQSVLQQSMFGRDEPSTFGGLTQVAQHQNPMSKGQQMTHQSSIQTMMLQSGINQSHMEIMHK